VKTAKEILEGALRFYEEGGEWIRVQKFKYSEGDDDRIVGACLFGALDIASDNGPSRSVAHHALLNRAGGSSCPLSVWNDAQTSVEPVLAVLRAAIADLEKQEGSK